MLKVTTNARGDGEKERGCNLSILEPDILTSCRLGGLKSSIRMVRKVANSGIDILLLIIMTDCFFLKTNNLLLRRKPISFKRMDEGPAENILLT